MGAYRNGDESKGVTVASLGNGSLGWTEVILVLNGVEGGSGTAKGRDGWLSCRFVAVCGRDGGGSVFTAR